MKWLEALLFRKVEAWVIVIIVALGVAVTILFGALVEHAASSERETGFWGELSLKMASIPKLVFALDKAPTDYVSPFVSSSYLADKYSKLSLSLKMGGAAPLVWSSGETSQALVVLVRVNDEGEEKLLVFNERRELVNSFDIRSDSLNSKFEALIGSSEVELLDDGTTISFPYGGVGLFRKNLCGDLIWSHPGLFHHHYKILDGKIYILGLPIAGVTMSDRELWNHSDILNVIDVETGNLERSIKIREIVEANIESIDPFLFVRWWDKINERGVLNQDFLHLNKIDVLSSELADQYPLFDEGVWLISAKFLNLILVFDPHTLEILWYEQGGTQVQHDPKFVGNNQIYVFNNGFDGNIPDHEGNPGNFTSIRSYDLGTGLWSELYNASGIKGFTSHSGNFDVSDHGNLLLNLAAQGRYSEIKPTGELIWELINKSNHKTVYWTKHAQYLDSKQLNYLENIKCD